LGHVDDNWGNNAIICTQKSKIFKSTIPENVLIVENFHRTMQKIMAMNESVNDLETIEGHSMHADPIL
jgi:ABC-type transport system involved in cytochrome bd biosynthesis fused ATPase/permease subunit